MHRWAILVVRLDGSVKNGVTPYSKWFSRRWELSCFVNKSYMQILITSKSFGKNIVSIVQTTANSMQGLTKFSPGKQKFPLLIFAQTHHQPLLKRNANKRFSCICVYVHGQDIKICDMYTHSYFTVGYIASEYCIVAFSKHWSHCQSIYS